MPSDDPNVDIKRRRAAEVALSPDAMSKRIDAMDEVIQNLLTRMERLERGEVTKEPRGRKCAWTQDADEEAW